MYHPLQYKPAAFHNNLCQTKELEILVEHVLVKLNPTLMERMERTRVRRLD